MKPTSLWLLLALAASLLMGCKDRPPSHVPGDGGPGDGGPGDGGLAVTVLRETLNIDLAQVDSFYVVSGTTAMSMPEPDSPVPRGYRKEGENPQLYALTLTGEVLTVSMVEGSDETEGDLIEPQITFIYPTASWIFFATSGFRVHVLLGDGTTLEIGCNTIAARREDGALFCSELGIGNAWGVGSRPLKSILSNAAGDLIYVMSQNALSQSVLYRLDMNGLEGPMATLIDSVAAVVMFRVNATGDLLVSHFGPTIGSTTLVTQIIPAQGGDATTLALMGGGLAGSGHFVAGTPGTADEDSFYILDGVSEFGYFPTSLRVLTKTGASFTEASHDLAQVPDTELCVSLHHLSTGIHMLCGGAIAKVVEDASVLEEPVVTPFERVDRLIDQRFAPGFVVLHAGEGSVLKFLRHDGAVQQDIPIDPNIVLIEFTVSPGGAIDFMGFNTTTNEKVIGAVPAGETEVTILSAEGIDTEQVVTFTRIN